MGETLNDRIDFIHLLANLSDSLYSIVINSLIPIKGTPLENNPIVPIWDLLRIIATLRVILPSKILRFAGGRHFYTQSEQLLFLMAGINSFHIGEKLLVTSNCSPENDEKLYQELQLELDYFNSLSPASMA